jgi:hypothetical protein
MGTWMWVGGVEGRGRRCLCAWSSHAYVQLPCMTLQAGRFLACDTEGEVRL